MSQIYTQVRELAEEFIAPYADELDQKKEFPVKAFQELGKAGYFSLLIPKEYGGMGLTLKEHAEVCMALAETSASAGLCYMMSNVAVNCLNQFGSAELKQKIFTDIVQNFSELTQAALKNCVIYNTIQQAFPFQIAFEQVL